MWATLADAAASSSGAPDNLYSVLAAVTLALIGTATTLLTRGRRRRPEVEPEPVARKVVSGVESLLKKRITQLEREAAVNQRERERLIAALATCQAERSDLMYRLRTSGGSDD